ncbi:MAG: HpcH/HpaI aldolase family protein [Anaerolineae bacterium]
MRSNSLRELLKQGKPTIGTHVMTTWPAVVELIGQTGQYDYVELVGEYTPYDLRDLENFARAVELFDGLSAMLKVDQEPRLFLAGRGIDAGLQNVLFADCRSVEDAKACVAAVRAETPTTGGIHGVGMRRNVGYVREPGSADFVQSLEDSVVALMIEKRGAVEQIDEIVSLDGVDMVQFGPADYAMSIGIPGQWSHPDVRAAERRTIEAALAKGMAPRAEIGSVDDAKRYLDMGVKHFCIGTDLVILSQWWRRSGEGIRAVIDKAG